MTIGTSFVSPDWGFTFPFSYTLSTALGTFYQLFYVILINFVLQAIISGLIIDTFSAMRNESDVIEEDIRKQCFICSIPRDEFDQVGLSYTTHIKEEHNMWHYVWFKIHLGMKDETTLSINEVYAKKCMEDKKVKFCCY
jgi:inositol 1,4,5-triphosphate receptor type 1